MFAEVNMADAETMLGDGARRTHANETTARCGRTNVQTKRNQILEAEAEMRELQRQVSKKANDVFQLKWELFMTCTHNWVVDRDDLTSFPGSPKLCTLCDMYDHGPRKQFF